MAAANTLFPYLRKDPSELPEGEDPFTITTRTGYLPFSLPLAKLPSQFDPVSNLLNDIPIQKEDGTPGLLATYGLGPVIDNGGLPDLTSEIDNLVVPGTDKKDMAAITAAFRDYSFIASSYLLEPCWEHYSKSDDGGYGLGRQTLPKCIAGPLVKCAEILDIPAFMSYAASYALYNYWLVHPEQGHDDYSNIRLVRAFEKGLDPKSSEAGFILTHIHMVAQTGGLIEGAVDLLAATEKTDTATKIAEAKASLELILNSMQIIETNMEGMWSQSLPKDYMTYRTFIYGITKQSMFPDGVVYEGQYDDKPQFFRGESGANDAIIPLLDHICEVPMPKNPLTDILVEFREYRPKPHRAFLKYVRETAVEVGVRDFLTKSGDHGLAVLYLRLLDHIRSFRWRHWMFTREYIIKHTLHPTATGGSPIITWLPNQLGAVMDLMEEVAKGSGLWAILEEGVWNGGGSLTQDDYILVKKIMDNVVTKKAQLTKEVNKYCQDRGV
ncbi:hypothetical protein FPOAC2_13070 [Fusarium poae]|jgi:indoleamine 2,3-dioxygenase|uniref:Indoleamine 2,3-dioxygenase n=1 Tax=Fusarium poae TaxID=36050 RepID=A0A1B8AHW5_FUSPO|nr:hypothetical protein FPOAC1_012709 [Fusarium poae]KAG8667870.1 hypothetical protein FPOAC1_012709 [Fusarium poae]OBS20092.1 hypothetical protein FPOA_11813 [Fusarium poae]